VVSQSHRGILIHSEFWIQGDVFSKESRGLFVVETNIENSGSLSNIASPIGFQRFLSLRWSRFETRGSREETTKKIQPC
jgi:hypothetical protein